MSSTIVSLPLCGSVGNASAPNFRDSRRRIVERCYEEDSIRESVMNVGNEGTVDFENLTHEGGF